ncbi:MAG: hypothetical protein DRJ42_06360 [Deltaproteobacteria bacterium]|nr:MAG: hypothetical protein DRJ42_06360 [Deltaproteobacteria bacterium]
MLAASMTTVAEAQVSGENLPEPSVAAERLDAIFARQAGHAEFGRYLGGIGGIAIGGTGIGVGTWLMLDDSSWADRDLALFTGGLMIGLGTVALAGGIYNLTRPSFGSDRYERFRLALADGLSEREVGQFEGELRLEAERGHFARKMGVITGFANILGGAGIVIATAAATTNGDQETTGYVIGSVLGGLGLLHALKSIFWPSRGERVWRQYLEGDMPEARASVTVEVVPSVSPENAGVTLLGSF